MKKEKIYPNGETYAHPSVLFWEIERSQEKKKKSQLKSTPPPPSLPRKGHVNQLKKQNSSTHDPIDFRELTNREVFRKCWKNVRVICGHLQESFEPCARVLRPLRTEIRFYIKKPSRNSGLSHSPNSLSSHWGATTLREIRTVGRPVGQQTIHPRPPHPSRTLTFIFTGQGH